MSCRPACRSPGDFRAKAVLAQLAIHPRACANKQAMHGDIIIALRLVIYLHGTTACPSTAVSNMDGRRQTTVFLDLSAQDQEPFRSATTKP